MSSWNNQTKNTGSWTNESYTQDTFDLLIGSGFKLNIGSGFYLKIGGSGNISWSNQTKN